MRTHRGIPMSLRVASLVAVALLAVLYWRPLGAALAATLQLGWIALLLLPLFGVWTYAAARGWRPLIIGAPATRAPSASRLAVISVEAQALNLVFPLAGLSGAALSASRLAAEGVGAPTAISSVVLDAAVSTAAGLLFAVFGLVLHPMALPGGSLHVAAVAALLGVLSLAALYALPTLHARASRWRWWRERAWLAQPLEPLAHGPGTLRRALHVSASYHLVERVLMGVEIWIAAWGIGLSIGFAGAMFAAGTMTASSLLFFFVPGQVGAVEGALSLAFRSLGLGGTAGLTVALIRRGRQLVVIVAGLIGVLWFDRRRDARGDGPGAQDDAASPPPPTERADARAIHSAR